jgi:hypothetical protein
MMPLTPKKASFVTDADIDFFVGEFKRSGFVGGLNYYRNVDRNWALTPFLDGARLRQPTLFIAGDRDGVLEFWGEDDPQRHHSLAFTYGSFDTGVAALSFTALVLWLLGYPDQALKKSQESLTLARALGHPFSFGQALVWTS